MTISDGVAFWEGDDEEREPTGFLSSLNGGDKAETGGGKEEGHEGDEKREPRLQGTVENGAKEVVAASLSMIPRMTSATKVCG